MKTAAKAGPPESFAEYLESCRSFFDRLAPADARWQARNRGYFAMIASLVRFFVPPHKKVLELGCGAGDLLAATEPAVGAGIDLSPAMIGMARARHPKLDFHEMAAEQLDLGGQTFDYVLLSDLAGYLYDIRLVFERIRACCHPDTRIVLHWHSRLWQPILTLAEKLRLRRPQPVLNWTTVEDIRNLLDLAGFETIRERKFILLPKWVPLISGFVNRYVAQLPLIRQLCLVNWVVARPVGLPPQKERPTLSIVCPCRNEAGNVREVARRLPQLGAHTELIFVEGHSKDDTLAECLRVRDEFAERDITVLGQSGKGKADAVHTGFARATGDILMILDADLSVAPEDLVQFYEALRTGKGEFASGSRLVYPTHPGAMRFLNLLGNKFFALLLSRLVGQPIKDTLCGTKGLWRHKYEELARGRSYFGVLDPFGDYDLIFGTAKLNLKTVEIPVRYHQRTYGDTNISRFADGLLLLRMCRIAAARLYFIR